MSKSTPLVCMMAIFVFNLLGTGANAGFLKNAMRAGGAAAGAARVYRSTIAEAGALTVPMLEQCIRLDKQYGDSYEKITGVDEKLESLSVELDQLKSYLETNGDKVDTSSQTAIDAFNRKVDAHGKKIDEHNGLLDSRKTEFASYEEFSAKFKKECSDQKYYEDDYETAVKNVGYAMSQ